MKAEKTLWIVTCASEDICREYSSGSSWDVGSDAIFESQEKADTFKNWQDDPKNALDTCTKGPHLVMKYVADESRGNVHQMNSTELKLVPDPKPCIFCVCATPQKIVQSFRVCGCPCHWQNATDCTEKLKAVKYFFADELSKL